MPKYNEKKIYRTDRAMRKSLPLGEEGRGGQLLQEAMDFGTAPGVKTPEHALTVKIDIAYNL